MCSPHVFCLWCYYLWKEWDCLIVLLAVMFPNLRRTLSCLMTGHWFEADVIYIAHSRKEPKFVRGYSESLWIFPETSPSRFLWLDKCAACLCRVLTLDLRAFICYVIWWKASSWCWVINTLSPLCKGEVGVLCFLPFSFCICSTSPFQPVKIYLLECWY